MADRNVRMHPDMPDYGQSDVDSALPIDLESSRLSPSLTQGEESSSPRRADRMQLPEVQLYKFGGSIVNSVTIHRLPGDGKGLADEDIIVLSNNDKTVTIYSLTQAKVLKVLHHQACMNYAIVSPDSSFLTAVGDENRAYFYHMTRDPDLTTVTENGEKLGDWDWSLHRCIEMDISTRSDEACFTVAFSPSSHLCAIGSQSGVIIVFDVDIIRRTLDGPYDKKAIICHFHSSRSYIEGGAVRCMLFSPDPWDLLVWLEDNGRAGVADVRQAFSRRQVLNLDMNDPGIQQVRTQPVPEDSEGLGFDFDSRSFPESRNELDPTQREMLDSIDGSSNEPGREGLDRSSLRENLIQDLTERERLIVEFLNTARSTSRLDESLTDRRTRPNVHLPPTSRSRLPGFTDGNGRPSRPTSPLRYNDALHDLFRESYLGHVAATDRNFNARRQDSVVLSQGHSGTNSRASEMADTNVEAQPSITLSWTTSPSELQSATLDNLSRAADPSTSNTSTPSNESGTGNRPQNAADRLSANFDPGNNTTSMHPLQRSHRSSSTPRRSERQESTAQESRHEPPRLLTADLRSNVAAERLRRQRQLINETHSRNTQREPRHRQQLLGFEQTRSPRWIRNILNELPDRSLHGHRDQEPGGTAGIGWGTDGRTLYVATVEGIFEYQINIHDRKTFPVFSYR
ncbi:hypothetical protein MW887_006391 [Aspergillus wentii]|nr:hypothetical protein MW887_006391 [Aspergillus wentii]